MGCIIVADDYGMSVEINNAISELVCKNIVSKVGVMANESIEYSMSDIGENVIVGLHFNLITYSKGEGINLNKGISLLKFLFLIYTKQITSDQIIDNINHQFEVVNRRGFKISYIDTHLHIHVVPKILKLLINYVKARGIQSIRCITMERKHLFYYMLSLVRSGYVMQVPKIILLYSVGALMKLRLEKSQIKYCKNLILMPLAENGDYSGLLKKLLNRFKDDDAELITHPGFEMKMKPDKYTKGRYVEYCSLLSQE
jgi:predicted glycoside hydrolase/deacetylase ChbG (UPF0249 family)